MQNIYWPVYKNLENEFSKLMFDIHIDDAQLGVYSLKTGNLIVRAAIEIESIAKELYVKHGGTKTGNIKYDEDALTLLSDLWLLEKKVVIISSQDCFQTNRLLYPFIKLEKRTGTERLTYAWNNSYQNLKHYRGTAIQFGSLKYLFEIMAALFVLNTYYKDETFNLKNDPDAISFPPGLGSQIFSISVHKWTGYDGQWNYTKEKNFDESIYITKLTAESLLKDKEAVKTRHWKMHRIFSVHPKFLAYQSANDITKYKGQNLMWDVLGKEDYERLLRDTFVQPEKSEVEAVLNKPNMP